MRLKTDGARTDKPIAYLAHNPITCDEKEITSFDKSDLRAAEEMGITLIAVYVDGTRSVVHAEDVNPPNPIVLATSDYVDERIEALFAIIEAMIRGGDLADVSSKLESARSLVYPESEGGDK